MNPLESIAKTLTDALYNLAFVFDRIVYSFIPKLYKLIVYLANVDLFDENPAVNALMNRVYILVGVFMLFKLSFSVVRYIVDPNSFSDQSKGFTSLVKRVLIALVLLLSVPWLFGKMYEIQGKILSSNIISNLILGTSDGAESDIEDTAKDIQFLIFGPFFSVKSVGRLSVCDPRVDKDYPLGNIIGTTDMALISNGKCLENFAAVMDENDDTVGATDVTIDKFFGDERDFSSLGVLISVSEEGERVVDYLPVVSTLCGGYLVFLLLSFCIDIGARAIKLIFLQVLSPVAIISSVDPTSSSQNDKLKDWGKECVSTFASLFLRLAVVFLVIQLVKVITAKLFAGSNLYYKDFRETADTSLNIFVYIFLILGSFQAAKKIPDLIEKAFGIKLSGELNLNPFKSLSEGLNNPLVGAVTGTVAGGAAGALAGFTTSMDMKRGLLRSGLSSVGGVFSGALGGSINGFRAKGARGFSAGSQVGGRISRRMEVREATGGLTGVIPMSLERTRRAVGMQTQYETMENNAKRYDDVRDGVTKMKDRIVEQLGKGDVEWTRIQASRKQVESDLEKGVLTPGDYAVWQQRLHDLEEARIKKYNDDSANGVAGAVDNDLEALRISQKKAMDDAHMSGDVNSWDSLSAVKNSANTEALNIRTDPKYNDAKDRADAIKLTEHDSFFSGNRGK